MTPTVTVTTNNSDVNLGAQHRDDDVQFQRGADRFQPGDTRATGGTLSNFTKVNATTYTATFTANAGTNISNASVRYDGSWHEDNGNAGTGGSTASRSTR